MSQLLEFMAGLDYSPLIVTLKTGVAAAFFSFFLGLFAARAALYSGPKVRSFMDTLMTLPLVLPPTVAGFILLLIFSVRRPFGSFLYENFGIKAVQTWLGCVLAAVVISFPLMYRSARAAFEQVDPNIIYAARTLGMKESAIFWRVTVPAAKPGIISGAILSFARALGEYGATSMLAGNIPGKTGTISQRIAMVIQDGDYDTAGFWVIVIMVIGFISVSVMNAVIASKSRAYRRW